MAAAAAVAGNQILLLYKLSILVREVIIKLTGLCFVVLFSMVRSCGAARISTPMSGSTSKLAHFHIKSQLKVSLRALLLVQ